MKKHYKQQHNAMYNGPFNVSDHNVIQCYFLRAGALVKWLWEETHVPKVVGSNPSTGYWMAMTFFTLICCKNCIVCMKKTENKRKRGRVWPILKKDFWLCEQCEIFLFIVDLCNFNFYKHNSALLEILYPCTLFKEHKLQFSELFTTIIYYD